MSFLDKRFQIFVNGCGINRLRIIEDQLYLHFIMEGKYEKQLGIVRKRILELS